MRPFLPLAALLGLAAACDRPAGLGPAAQTFGAATRGNHAVQSGAADAMSAVGARFRASVPTTITFAFDSAALDATAQAVLAQQADFMRQFPEVRFSVYGHADLVGPSPYNEALGLRRARAAVAFLAARGVSPGRLDALVSLGETQPLVPTPLPERANRRTVTTVSGFVADHPLVLDGKYARIAYRRYVAGSGVAGTAANQLGSGGAGDAL